jgi:hypothetical protein
MYTQLIDSICLKYLNTVGIHNHSNKLWIHSISILLRVYHHIHHGLVLWSGFGVRDIMAPYSELDMASTFLFLEGNSSLCIGLNSLMKPYCHTLYRLDF